MHQNTFEKLATRTYSLTTMYQHSRNESVEAQFYLFFLCNYFGRGREEGRSACVCFVNTVLMGNNYLRLGR